MPHPSAKNLQLLKQITAGCLRQCCAPHSGRCLERTHLAVNSLDAQSTPKIVKSYGSISTRGEHSSGSFIMVTEISLKSQGRRSRWRWLWVQESAHHTVPSFLSLHFLWDCRNCHFHKSMCREDVAVYVCPGNMISWCFLFKTSSTSHLIF